MDAISIIIPTYNMQRALIRCLAQVAEQSLKPSEVVIVDDGSTDGTTSKIEEYKHSFPIEISLLSQDHRGASTARNYGFKRSHGNMIMFLDADVVLKKHAFERLYNALTQNSILNTENLGVGYAYSSFRWGWKKFSSYSFDAARLRQMPYIHTTSLIKREALPENPFDEHLKRLQDWDLYLTLLERGTTGAYVPEILFTVETKGTMSRWLPSIMYQIPFTRFGVQVPKLEKFIDAEQIVRAKHRLHD